MSLAIYGVLASVGLVAFLLLGEIRRVQRAFDEAVRGHQSAINKIPELENQLRILTKKLEASGS